jgi:hypothetical protein
MKPLAACVEQVTGARHPISTLDCVLPHIYSENVHVQCLPLWVSDNLRDVDLAILTRMYGQFRFWVRAGDFRF